MPYSLFPMMIIIPLLALALTQKNFLMCLLNLEAMTLGLLMYSSMSLFMQSETEVMIALLLLSLGACEASLGLACLVKMTRTLGSDNLTSLDMTKC